MRWGNCRGIPCIEGMAYEFGPDMEPNANMAVALNFFLMMDWQFDVIECLVIRWLSAYGRRAGLVDVVPIKMRSNALRMGGVDV